MKQLFNQVRNSKPSSEFAERLFGPPDLFRATSHLGNGDCLRALHPPHL